MDNLIARRDLLIRATSLAAASALGPVQALAQFAQSESVSCGFWDGVQIVDASRLRSAKDVWPDLAQVEFERVGSASGIQAASLHFPVPGSDATREFQAWDASGNVRTRCAMKIRPNTPVRLSLTTAKGVQILELGGRQKLVLRPGTYVLATGNPRWNQLSLVEEVDGTSVVGRENFGCLLLRLNSPR